MEQNENRFLKKIGTPIGSPRDKGYCKNCQNRQSENYCRAIDNSCDKVWICRCFFPSRRSK